MTESSSDNLNIMSYLKIFFRRKEIIIIPTILGLTVGICTGILLPKKYRSSAVILVEEGKTDNPLFNEIAVSTTVSQRLTTISESMLGWTSLVELVKRLNLDSDVRTRKQYERLILDIRRNIGIQLKGQNILTLTYVDRDPVKTQAVVQNITDIFIERNKKIQDQETADAITFIESQLKVYKGKIKSAEIAELQDKLDELMLDSTEKHPMVKQLREKLNSKKSELKAENLEFTKPEKIEKETTNPIIVSIKKALDNIESTKTEKEKSPESDGDLFKAVLLSTVAARDVKVNEQVYNMLLQRLETAKITQTLQKSKEGTKYTILDPPRVPLEPFRPNKLLVAIAGMIAGLLLGGGLILAGEFFDKSFIDVEDAKEHLGVPLLGAISKIETEDSLRYAREKKIWMYSLALIGGVAIIIITLTLENYIR